MMILTRNTHTRGRSIVRVSKHLNFGYNALHGAPRLSWEGTGQDGKTYRVLLDAVDLAAIDRARKEYPAVELYKGIRDETRTEA